MSRLLIFPLIRFLSGSSKPSTFRASLMINIVLYCLYLYPGFYSYTEGATWKILDLLTIDHGFFGEGSLKLTNQRLETAISVGYRTTSPQA